MFGCHYNIRLNSVLVNGQDSILSIFSESRSADSPEDVEKFYEGGAGDYCAPECEEPDNDFKPRRIGPLSDIWCFGCLLVDVMTYMTMGAAGVQEFGKRRKFQFSPVFSYRFYTGRKTSSAVDLWLWELESQSLQASKVLVLIARDILCLEATARPSAIEVTNGIRLAALYSAVQAMDEMYMNTTIKLEKAEDTEMIIAWTEQILLFEAWKCSIGWLPEISKYALGWKTLPLGLDLPHTLSCLSGTKESLQELSVSKQSVISTANMSIIQLKELNVRLSDLLGPELDIQAKIHLTRLRNEASLRPGLDRTYVDSETFGM